MASQYGLTYKDYDGENSRVQWDIIPLNAGNLVAQLANLATLLSAVQAVSLGNLQSERVILSDTLSSRSPATDKGSQRELKWLVEIEDATTHRLTRNEIPCADTSLLDNNSEYLALGAGAGAALKAAVEAVVKFPGTGNAVLVNSVKLVGKRI